MKNILVFSLFLTATIMAKAQTNPSVKVYGFVQRVIPGAMAKGDVDESGQLGKSESSNRSNYRIYLTVPNSPRTYPVSIWIKGQPYSVSSKTIGHTPITATNYNIPSHPKTTVLVPDTGNKVLQLTPIPAVESKLTDAGRAMADQNEVVVAYKLGGKMYYAALPQLTELDAQAMQ